MAKAELKKLQLIQTGYNVKTVYRFYDVRFAFINLFVS